MVDAFASSDGSRLLSLQVLPTLTSSTFVEILFGPGRLFAMPMGPLGTGPCNCKKKISFSWLLVW